MTKKRFYLLCIAIFAAFSFSACSSDKDENGPDLPPTPHYEEYISTDTEAILKKLNFVIYKGDTPPNVEGKYFGNDIVVTNSTLLTDALLNVGKIGEMTYNLFNQKENKTISSKLEFKYTSSSTFNTEEYSGVGTLISGTGNNFTIYSIYDGVLQSSAGEAKAKLLYLISGTLVKDQNGKNSALKDVSSVLLMLDDYGDPLDVLIRNNNGRKFVSLYDAKKID